MEPDARPSPGDLPLHICGGVVRLWLVQGTIGNCYVCKNPLAADAPYMKGHAYYYCRACQRIVGLCAAPLLADVAEAARLVIAGS